MRKSINVALSLLLIASAAGLLTGCITIPGGLHPAYNKDFQARVEAAVPSGSTEQDALRIMTASGYHCTIQPSSDARQPSHTVICGSHGHIVGQFFDRDWSVTFLIENGRVASIAAVTDLNGS